MFRIVIISTKYYGVIITEAGGDILTIDQLGQYRKLKGRLLLLEEERDGLILRSKAGDGIGVRGGMPSNTVAQTAEEREIKQRDIDSLKRRLNAIESYIRGCEEYYGIMLRLHYIDGKTWTAIAMIQGGNNTKESVRKSCHRYVQRNP